MTPSGGDAQDILDRVIAAYLKAVDVGEAPDRAEIIARHPELAADLRAFFETQDVFLRTRADGTRALPRLGDFEILREIGRGGMGIVYEARQLSLNRHVALKVVHGGLGLTPRAVLRFRREAEAAARLHHTNIVPIYATGEEAGNHYYAMEVIEGPSLDRVIDAIRREEAQPASGRRPETDGFRGGGGLPAWVLQIVAREPPSSRSRKEPLRSDESGEDVAGSASANGREKTVASSSALRSGNTYFDTLARMIADVADAVQYAHDHGVIHRDIKPSNLLLSPDGRLSLNDFGLARMVEQPGMTTTGEFVGTPAYMSPEQIVAGRAPVDHRTDVYSLGASLYELLTLERPFPGDRREQVLAQILHKDPLPPRRIHRKIPVDLETICLKALEKDPDRRYQTAAELAGDLRRYVSRFALTARRVGPLGRAIKWARRRPAVAVLGSCVLLLALAAGLFAHRAHVAEEQRIASAQQSARESASLAAMNGDFEAAEAAISRAESLGVSSGWTRMLRGKVASQRGEPSEAIENLEQAIRVMPRSVAAHAMLVEVFLSSGQFERAVEALYKARQFEPVTADDFLFKGLAESLFQPESSLESLDEAVRRGGSSLAYLVRCRVRAYHAWDTGDAAEAERALEDATVARSKLLGDQPYLTSSKLQAHLVAATIYERAGDTERRAEHVAAAERDAASLERVRDRFLERAWYYEYIGPEEAALEEWRHAGERGNAWGIENCILVAYQRGNFSEALRISEEESRKSPERAFDLFRAYVLVELDRARDALEICEKRVARAIESGASFYPAMLFPSIPRILGDNPRADELSRKLRGSLRMIPGSPAWLEAVLDYNCGDLTDEAFLARADRSRWSRCEGHFQIGLRRLAAGDRDAAREHFRAALSSKIFPFYEYRLSRAFLRRMDDDPAWPRRAPSQEE